MGWRLDDIAALQGFYEKHLREAEPFGCTCREHGLRVHPVVVQVDVSRHTPSRLPPTDIAHFRRTHLSCFLIRHTHPSPKCIIPLPSCFPPAQVQKHCMVHIRKLMQSWTSQTISEPNMVIQTQTTGGHAQALVVFHEQQVVVVNIRCLCTTFSTKSYIKQ